MTVAAFFLLALGYGFYRYFHRIPLRKTPSNPNAIVCPADGVIWQIIPLDRPEGALTIKKRYLGQIKTLAADVENASTVVSIFMNPLDCHANWSPVEGKILYAKHTPGNFSFANGWNSLFNEKNEILIQFGGYKLKVIQIAGFVARRIDCWVQKNDTLLRGQVFGMIRLGSQVSLILPSQIHVEVQKGQKVRGGETILGSVEPVSPSRMP